jgi:hypothetical protein
MNSALRRRLASIERRLPPVVEPPPSAVDRLIGLYNILIPCNQRVEAKGNSTIVRTAQLRAWRTQWRKAKRADPVEAARQAETTLDAWRSRLLPILERLQKEHQQRPTSVAS